MDELGQEVGGLLDRVVGPGPPYGLVALARLLVGVVTDPRRVREEMPDGHAGRDCRALEAEVADRARVQPEGPGVDLLERGHGREQLGDRGGVEARGEGVGHVPRPAGEAVRAREPLVPANRDPHDAREGVAIRAVAQLAVELLDGHGQAVVRVRASRPSCALPGASRLGAAPAARRRDGHDGDRARNGPPGDLHGRPIRLGIGAAGRRASALADCPPTQGRAEDRRAADPRQRSTSSAVPGDGRTPAADRRTRRH